MSQPVRLVLAAALVAFVILVVVGLWLWGNR